MNESTIDRDPIERLADSFVARYRRGERPSIDEYAAKYPELADSIRDLLRALVVIEQGMSAAGDTTGTLLPKPDGDDQDASRQLGDYLILREIGRGGMGVVYEAVQQSLGRHVALKILPPRGDFGSSQLDRFLLEARAAARLHHANIVPVFGVGEQEGVHYYAMQFIRGQGLDGVLDELRRLRADKSREDGPPDLESDPLRLNDAARGLLTGHFARAEAGPLASSGPPEAAPEPSSLAAHAYSEREARPYFREIARLGLQVAEALAHAHGRGVLHRDIKPSNLLLDAGGNAWVTDFGLAKAEGADDLTRTGDIVGTLRYMAPERFDGWSDRRSDVYSLGATLYELLTLRPPFVERDRARLIERVLREEPPPPRRIDPLIPPDLETIVLKALAKEPAARYASAEQLADDLRRFLADQPILARRSRSAERAWRWCRRNPSLAALTATVAASLLAGAIVAGYFAIQAGRRAEESQRNLYVAHMNLAQEAWSEGRTGRVLDLLEAQRPAPGGADRRGWEWHYQWRLCHDDLRTMRHGDTITDIAFSPDGRFLASSGDDVRIWEVATGRLVRVLVGHTKAVMGVAFSPDGRRIASCGSDFTVRTWDAADGHPIWASTPLDVSMLKCVGFSPDGRLVLAGGYRFDDASKRVTGHLRAWSSSTGAEAPFGIDDTTVSTAFAFSPDGRVLASGYNDVRLTDVATGERKSLEGRAQAVRDIAFRPDGRLVATADSDQSVVVWDIGTGLPLFPSILGGGSSVAFSPDGRAIVTGSAKVAYSTSSSAAVKLWDAETGDEIRTYLGHTAEVSCVAYSPDGRLIASADFDGALKLWDAGKGSGPGLLADSDLSSTDLAFSPDGRLLATVSTDRTLQFWDADTRFWRRTIRHAGELGAVAFSPDGSRIAAAGGQRGQDASDGFVVLRDAATGREIRTLTHPRYVLAVAFSPDGRSIASAGVDSVVRLWDAIDGRELRSWKQADMALGLAFSPDGRSIATGQRSRGEIGVLDVSGDRPSRYWKGHDDGVNDLVFSRDGRRLFSAGDDRAVRIWDVASGGQVLALTGQSLGIKAIAVSPDGTRLAAAESDDGPVDSGDATRVRLWDLITGQEVGSIEASSFKISGLAFSPDGNRIAAAGSNEVLLWDARPPSPAFHEAIGLVDLFASRPMLREDMLPRIREDATISSSVRRLALELASSSPDDPARLNSACWEMVSRPGQPVETYRRAVRMLEVASRAEPDDWFYLNSLGVAQYRAGAFSAALTTLDRSTRMNPEQPADLAFLAMSHHRLGHTEAARSTLARLRESVEGPSHRESPEALSFLREAETLIDGPFLPTDPFARP